jgi:hypothetical protein
MGHGEGQYKIMESNLKIHIKYIYLKMRVCEARKQ